LSGSVHLRWLNGVGCFRAAGSAISVHGLSVEGRGLFGKCE
jgi:hypothetical protein